MVFQSLSSTHLDECSGSSQPLKMERRWPGGCDTLTKKSSFWFPSLVLSMGNGSWCVTVGLLFFNCLIFNFGCWTCLVFIPLGDRSTSLEWLVDAEFDGLGFYISHIYSKFFIYLFINVELFMNCHVVLDWSLGYNFWNYMIAQLEHNFCPNLVTLWMFPFAL